MSAGGFAPFQWPRPAGGREAAALHAPGYFIRSPEAPLGAAPQVNVGPTALHAPACLLRGLDTPGAGGRGMLTFHVHGRDAFGNVARLGPRALAVAAEPPGALADVAMSQWEDKAVVTVRATVVTAGVLRVAVDGAPVCAAGIPLAAAADGARANLVRARAAAVQLWQQGAR
jgi:hypothetical protein